MYANVTGATETGRAETGSRNNTERTASPLVSMETKQAWGGHEGLQKNWSKCLFLKKKKTIRRLVPQTAELVAYFSALNCFGYLGISVR